MSMYRYFINAPLIKSIALPFELRSNAVSCQFFSSEISPTIFTVANIASYLVSVLPPVSAISHRLNYSKKGSK